MPESSLEPVAHLSSVVFVGTDCAQHKTRMKSIWAEWWSSPELERLPKKERRMVVRLAVNDACLKHWQVAASCMGFVAVYLAIVFAVFWLASSLGFVEVDGEFPNQQVSGGPWGINVIITGMLGVLIGSAIGSPIMNWALAKYSRPYFAKRLADVLRAQ